MVPPLRPIRHFRSTLWVARLPIILVGVLGCIAIFEYGILVKDTRVGFFAAIGLMLNPLYRVHAHRAMSDVPAKRLRWSRWRLFLWYVAANLGWTISAFRSFCSLFWPGLRAGLSLLSQVQRNARA